MPVKILLADKSITIQKVVEMLFSGREYEVVCVSDGETALNEATRAVPDVALVDVDLPRIDGYSLAARLKKISTLVSTPVILMMSRDDVYEDNKGKQAGIIDYIAKPFESQELIGKVKKALAAAPPRQTEPAPRAFAPPQQATAPPPPRTVTPSATKPKKAAPADIFDIISKAPTNVEQKQEASSAEEEYVYEVEPVVEEVEAPFVREESKVLPIGSKAVEEMRAGLGLTEKSEEPLPDINIFESFETAMEAVETTASPKPPQPAPVAPRDEPLPEIVTFETLDAAMEADRMTVSASRPEKPAPATQPPPTLPTDELRKIVEETVAKMAEKVFKDIPPPSPPKISEEMMRKTAEEAVANMAEKVFKDIPPPSPPKISDETIRRGIQEAVMKIAREIGREVIEQVAWEVIPQLAENMIKKEIERLKAET